MRVTNTHVFFWSGPLSNWHLGKRFSGERAWSETIARLDGIGIQRPSDAALSSRLLRAASFSCGEQWMMACKAWLFDRRDKALDEDPLIDVEQVYALIRSNPTPAKMSALAQILHHDDPRTQKQLGSAKGPIQNFSEEVWDKARVPCVVSGTIARMEADPRARKVLLDSGNRILVEGSPHDKIWGVGLKWDDPKIEYETNWRGLNLLGQAHAEARRALERI